MRIARRNIINVRSIKALDIDLNRTTILIGSDNTEKIEIIDSVRFVLTRPISRVPDRNLMVRRGRTR
jgi:predicted ATP-binding protein involved in virulence